MHHLAKSTPDTFSRFLILVLLLLLGGCGLIAEEEDETLNWSASKLYAAATESMSDGNYTEAIKYYETLEASYPFGRYAMQAQLGVAYAYYKAEEPESALVAAERFIRLHPRSEHVDYAYYLKGIVNFNRSIGFIERFLPVDSSQRDPGSMRSSFNNFSQLIEKFPNSEYAADARKRMIYLRNLMAEHELHVARYYYKTNAWAATVNRCKAILENHSSTPSARPALELMIEAYAKLGMDDLAADTRRVLELNIANGNFVEAQVEEQEEASLSRRVWDFLQLDEG